MLWIYTIILMYLFKKSRDLQAFLTSFRERGLRIGFVPTMGALHAGHLSLIRQSLDMAHLTVCSIFVNPTQFNEAADLQKYPRTPGRDLELLHRSGCHVAFLPAVEEVYPPSEEVAIPEVKLGHLAEVMEGAHRPGHFEGVMQVVKRLISLVEPSHLFMGRKDYQQLVIIQEMVRQLQLGVEVIGCPTLRDPDGLAMSSRNARLSPEERQQALAIYQTLTAAAGWLDTLAPPALKAKAMKALKGAGLQPEYFELARADTLQIVDAFAGGQPIIACTAARAGSVRLIDNFLVRP